MSLSHAGVGPGWRQSRGAEVQTVRTSDFTVLVSSPGDGTRRECVVSPEGVHACGTDACGPAWRRSVTVLVLSAWVIPLLSKNA